MPILHLKYCSHITVIAGKLEETIKTKDGTANELILKLDEKYPGLKKLFISNGILNLNTMIFLMRTGEPTVAVSDLNTKFKDGDVLILI